MGVGAGCCAWAEGVNDVAKRSTAGRKQERVFIVTPLREEGADDISGHVRQSVAAAVVQNVSFS